MAFVPTHWLSWAPLDHTTSLSWPVRVIRDLDTAGPFLAALTEDEWERGSAPAWCHDEREGVWRWRGLSGYRGRRGAVEVRSLATAR